LILEVPPIFLGVKLLWPTPGAFVARFVQNDLVRQGGFECKDFDEAGLSVEEAFSPERGKKLPYEGKQHAVPVEQLL
jgi:hypothetical protein